MAQKEQVQFIQVTLIVKVHGGDRDATEKVIVRRLDEWFNHRLSPPFNDHGTLIRYEIDPKPIWITIDPSLESHAVVKEKTL